MNRQTMKILPPHIQPYAVGKNYVRSVELPMFHTQCIAVGKKGEIFLATHSAIYMYHRGHYSHIAGHWPDTGFSTQESGGDARFDAIEGIVLEKEDTLVICEYNNPVVRRVSLLGQVSILAGSQERGNRDGVGVLARFNSPIGIDIDSKGMIYVCDAGNHNIRIVHPHTGLVTTVLINDANSVAPICIPGFLNKPQSVAVDMNDDLIVVDKGHNCVRKINVASGEMFTIAGNGEPGDKDGAGEVAQFSDQLRGAVVDGNNNIILADHDNWKIRMITKDGMVSTMAGWGNPDCAYNDSRVWSDNEDDECDGPGVVAGMLYPVQVAITQNGEVVVLEDFGEWLRFIDASLEPPLRVFSEKMMEARALRSLQSDMRALLDNDQTADIVIVTNFNGNTVRFSAHRVILMARSKYFQALFSFGKTRDKEVVLEDVNPTTFSVFLRFLYTHEIPPLQDLPEGATYIDIMQTADYFDSSALCDICSRKIREYGLTANTGQDEMVEDRP